MIFMESFMKIKANRTQNSDSALIQNVIARITHGIIGLDLLYQGKKDNMYLNDLLSLEDEEIENALKSKIIDKRFAEFFPLEKDIITKQVKEITDSINITKKLIENRDINKDEIINMIYELENMLAILYKL